jgi:flavin reductase (DIM6/NTAB) family NADH-FMN oxidoreductase RutF
MKRSAIQGGRRHRCGGDRGFASLHPGSGVAAKSQSRGFACCRIVQVTEVGTHSVFFCEVDAIRIREVTEGLIYFGRGYHPVRVA